MVSSWAETSLLRSTVTSVEVVSVVMAIPFPVETFKPKSRALPETVLKSLTVRELLSGASMLEVESSDGSAAPEQR